jgi:hypothetical protein
MRTRGQHVLGGLWLAALALLLGGASVGGTVRADFIILDHSPGTTGATVSVPYENLSSTQNFADRVLFPNAALLTGMDIYTSTTVFPSVGQAAMVRVWAGSPAAPGDLLVGFTTSISAIDSQGAVDGVVRLHADFTSPVSLAADTTYWIGMSSEGRDFGQIGLFAPNAPDDGLMQQFNGLIPQGPPRAIGDMAFRLEGEVISTVPAPPSLILLGTGLPTLAAWGWRRRKGAAACGQAGSVPPSPC